MQSNIFFSIRYILLLFLDERLKEKTDNSPEYDHYLAQLYCMTRDGIDCLQGYAYFLNIVAPIVFYKKGQGVEIKMTKKRKADRASSTFSASYVSLEQKKVLHHELVSKFITPSTEAFMMLIVRKYIVMKYCHDAENNNCSAAGVLRFKNVLIENSTFAANLDPAILDAYLKQALTSLASI